MFHGTHPLSNAQSIARRGPDFTLIGSANGHLYGRGFYTTSNIKTAAAYAQSKGAICVCCATMGNAKPNGSKEDTSDMLLQQNFHSVASGDIRVLFHPDSVYVQYVINEVADASTERELAEKQQQLDAAWQDADLGRQKDLQVIVLPSSLFHKLCVCVSLPDCRSQSCLAACLGVGQAVRGGGGPPPPPPPPPRPSTRTTRDERSAGA